LDADDRLRLDYEQTTQLYRALVDVRFKLLAIVPTISGTAVGLLGRPRPAAELLAVGVLGLVATLGILLYELRNTQLHDAAIDRAKELEKGLGFPSTRQPAQPGGLFRERPQPQGFLGPVTVVHGRALALVYGAALAGWGYLVAWGALRALDVPDARKAGAAIGVAVGLLVVSELERGGHEQGKPGSPAADA